MKHIALDSLPRNPRRAERMGQGVVFVEEEDGESIGLIATDEDGRVVALKMSAAAVLEAAQYLFVMGVQIERSQRRSGLRVKLSAHAIVRRVRDVAEAA